MGTKANLRSIAGRMRRRLKADVCQVPLGVPQVTEAACLGATLLAGVGAGVYPDLGTAVNRAVCIERRFDPRPDSVAAHEERYRLYKQVYPTLISPQRQL